MLDPYDPANGFRVLPRTGCLLTPGNATEAAVVDGLAVYPATALGRSESQPDS
jgi:hypothetical protein